VVSGAPGQVAVAKLDASGTSRRWLRTARARLGKAVEGCVRPVWLAAKGTRRWIYRFRKTLPKGRYKAIVRGTDGRGRAQGCSGAPSRDTFTLR
jgi:hypothetical protein